MKATVYIGFGANLGDRLANIVAALQRLQRPELILKTVSSVYETEPLGVIDQQDFLNGAACFITTLTPAETLDVCLDVERAGGRERRVRWGARTIDLDVLLYDSQQIATEALTVPHPELANRRFVLEPLAEIAPERTVVGLEKSIRRLLAETQDRGRVRLHLPAAEFLKLIREV